MTSAVLDQGPLSWQQEAYLRGLSRNGHDNVWVSFEIPGDVSDDEMGRRLARMVEREDSLRVVGTDRAGVTYADTVDLPVRRTRCPDAAGVRAFVADHKKVPFGPGKPLWNLTVIEHPTAGGGTGRTAVAVFDHLVADMVSLALLRRELCTGVEPSAGRGAGRYREWVTGQRAEFDARAPHAAALGFWDDHLDGTSPGRPTPMPGVLDARPGRGDGTVWISVHVPVSAAELRAAARRARATPHTLAVASVVATVAGGSGTDDVTLRLVSNGRTPASAATFGWLATCNPIRVRGRDLGRPGPALAAVRAVWPRMLPHQHTPWEYLCATRGPRGGTGPQSAGRRQLLVNFFPEAVRDIDGSDLADHSDARRIGHVELLIVPLGSGGFLFRMMVDSGDLDLDSVRRFLDRLAGDFTGTVRAAAAGATR